MTNARKVLSIARRELGYIEKGNNNTKFGKWYGMNYQPWCAMFVSYCFYCAGVPLQITTPKGFAYCPYGVTWFRRKNKLVKVPQPGDIVFFDWRNDGISDHVGIVEKVLNNGWVQCIEGNTSPSDNSNGGQVMRRKRHYRQICGFGRPDWNQSKQYNSSLFSRNIYLRNPYMIGADVFDWQKQMIKLGYDLGVCGADGYFGEDSAKALIKFQKDHGLEVDGILGPISWKVAFKNA